MNKMFATGIEKIIAGAIVGILLTITVLWAFGVVGTDEPARAGDDWAAELNVADFMPPSPERPERDGPELPPYTVVARFDGSDVYAYAVRQVLRTAQNMLMWDYVEIFDMWDHLDMFGDVDPDFERLMPDGRTFGRHVLEEAVRLVAQAKILAEYAERLGITPTPDHIADVEDMIQNAYLEMGPVNFAEALRADGLRDRDHLREMLEVQQVQHLTISAIMDDPAEFAAFEHNMQPESDGEVLGAKHILAMFNNFDTEAEARVFAEEMLERALAGEDFDMLVREYGQDPGMLESPQGYTFVQGVMVDEFYQATKAMEIGEISGLVRSSFGYHIILRVEPDYDDIMQPWGVPTREEMMVEAIFVSIESIVAEANIVFLPALDDIDVWPYIPQFVN